MFLVVVSLEFCNCCRWRSGVKPNLRFRILRLKFSGSMSASHDDVVLSLLQYDHRCTDKLAAKIEPLRHADLIGRFPIGHGTLDASFYHVVVVAEKWTDRSRPDPTGVIGKTYPGPGIVPIAQLRERYRAAAEQMLRNIAALNATGEPARDVHWLIKRNHLVHITTHGMHHHAQIINMLTQLGVTGLIEGGDFGGWANRPLKRDQLGRG